MPEDISPRKNHDQNHRESRDRLERVDSRYDPAKEQ